MRYLLLIAVLFLVSCTVYKKPPNNYKAVAMKAQQMTNEKR
mgnify:CR=1 FL=1